MPVTDEQIERGVSVLRRHGATKIILFGSAATDPRNANDVDFACEGIPPESFFKAAADLEDAVDTPVDLIDLAHRSAFVDRVKSRGRIVFETIDIREEFDISMSYALNMNSRLSECLGRSVGTLTEDDLILAFHYLTGMHRAILNTTDRFIKWSRPEASKQASGDLKIRLIALLLGSESGLFGGAFVEWFDGLDAIRELHSIELRTEVESVRVAWLATQANDRLKEFRMAIDEWIVDPEPIARLIDDFLARIDLVAPQLAKVL